MAFLRRFFSQKISFKLALVMGAVTVGLIAVFSSILMQVSQQALRRSAKISHEQIAIRTAKEVTLFIKRPEELLSIVGSFVGRSHADAAVQSTALVELSLHHNFFEEIVSIALDGSEEASSNPGQLIKKWGEDTAFLEASKGKTYVSSIYIADNHFPYITIAVPYRNFGKVRGVIRGRVNLRGIWNIVDDIHIGKTGQAFLVSSEGWVIAHPDKKLVLRNINVIENLELKKLLKGDSQSVEYMNPSGKKYLASYAVVEGNIPLGVIVEMASDEAFYLLYRVKVLLLWVLGVSLAASALTSFLLAKWLVRPIRSLQEWGRKIAMGDFNFSIAPNTSDEIGKLFIMFKRMSEKLRAARERERLAALGEVSTMISHKLKNSIVSLKTFAQILPQKRSDEQFMKRFEEKFSATVKHLEKIFMDLSHIASSKEIQKESLSIVALLEHLRDSYQEVAQRQCVDFRLEFGESLPLLCGDYEQLKEMFSNLIQNAFQAMPNGGILAIRVFYIADSSFLRITVRDTGSGIEALHVSNVFKPFFTTKNGGMGLGLSVSKKIAEDHHGSLTLVRHDSEGCLFQILFPLRSLEFKDFPKPATEFQIKL